MSLTIDSDFDGGNIRCLAARAPDRIRLEIVPDAGGEFFQWFYFSVRGAAGKDCVLRIENAGGVTYPDGWRDYRAVASEDGEDLAPRRDRVRRQGADDPLQASQATRCASPTSRLTRWSAMPSLSSAWRPRPSLPRGGSARPSTARRSTCWRSAEQGSAPAGSSGASIPARPWPNGGWRAFWSGCWTPPIALARALLEKARFFVVPNMNPDGSRRGHLRTNAAGVNLNRAWAAPSMEQSPEVFLVSAEMARTGVDFCLDVHGDEALPYNFIAGPEGIPSYTDALAQKLAHFQAALVAANPNFQTKYGYPPTPPGKANLRICANFVAETYGCLAMTLEMPFKDAANAPDPRDGWSPARCHQLGRSSLEALTAVIDEVR